MGKTNSVAEAASTMAFRLWRSEHGGTPKASDRAAFLALVTECVEALRGRPYDYARALEKAL